MNHVEKEMAENFYGTGERDHQLMLRCDGVRGCDSERDAGWPERRTVPGGQKISLAGARCGYVCDWFEFTHDGGRSPHVSRRLDFVQVFSFSFGAYLLSKPIYICEGCEGRAVNDTRLGGFLVTHLEPYSQAADVVRLPEQKRRDYRAYVGKTSEGRAVQAQSPNFNRISRGGIFGANGVQCFRKCPLFIAFISR